MTFLGIAIAVAVALLYGGFSAGTRHPAPVRQAHPRHRWFPGFGVGFAIPLPGPLYAWLPILRWWRR